MCSIITLAARAGAFVVWLVDARPSDVLASDLPLDL
jgi:hypothetical protein